MKLIIDIPDVMYSDIQKGIIRKHIDKVFVAIENGTPVSNEGDLISRSALKEKIDFVFPYDPLADYEENIGEVMKLIDNAPTVEPQKIVTIPHELIEKLVLCVVDTVENIDWDKAIEAYKERPQNEWIPVSEKLPEEMRRVLIWFEYYRYGDFNCMYQTYGFGYVLDGKWSPFINGETGWHDYKVIAWQPLPEPYKEGGEED